MFSLSLHCILARIAKTSNRQWLACLPWNRWLILCHAGPAVDCPPVPSTPIPLPHTPIAPTWPLFSIVCLSSLVWSWSIQAAGHCCINSGSHCTPRMLGYSAWQTTTPLLGFKHCPVTILCRRTFGNTADISQRCARCLHLFFQYVTTLPPRLEPLQT